MKNFKYIYILSFLLFCGTISAQEEILTDSIPANVELEDEHGTNETYEHDDNYDDDDDRDITINLGWDYDNDQKNSFRVALLDIGVSSLMNGGKLNLPSALDDYALIYPGSININLHLFKHQLRLAESPIFFDYGVSINWRQYKFENKFRIEPKVDNINFIYDDVDYSLNKLRTSYFEFPITFSYKPKNSGFHIGVGAYAFMKIGSNQKLKSDEFGKEKIKDDFNLRNFGTGLQTRFGFGPVEFYVQYGFQSLFVDEISTDLKPLTFGISLLGF